MAVMEKLDNCSNVGNIVEGNMNPGNHRGELQKLISKDYVL